MNYLTVFILMASTLLAAAQSYNVRCPNCLKEQVLVATSVISNGGSLSTNKLGMVGNIETRSANFHCPECHSDFTAPIKPDRFVPMMTATLVAPVPHAPIKNPNALAVTPTITTNYVEEVVRTMMMPDGSELVVTRRIRR